MSKPNTTTENDPSEQAGENGLFDLAILLGLGLEIAQKLEKLGQVHPSIAIAMAMDLAIRKARIDLSEELNDAERRSVEAANDAAQAILAESESSNSNAAATAFELLDRSEEAEAAVAASQQALDEAMEGAPQNDFTLQEDFELAVGMLDVYLAGRSQPAARIGQAVQRHVLPIRRSSRQQDETISATYREQTNRRTTSTVLAGPKRPSPSESEAEG